MVCERAVEDVLECVDFIAEAAGVGLLLPNPVQPFIRGEKIVTPQEQPTFLVGCKTWGPFEKPCINPRDIVAVFLCVCVDQVRDSREGITEMGGGTLSESSLPFFGRHEENPVLFPEFQKFNSMVMGTKVYQHLPPSPPYFIRALCQKV